MSSNRKDSRRPPSPRERDQQRLEASKRGAAAVQRAFSEPLTRKVFARRVGKHPTTIRRWESHGLVEPTLVPVLSIPTLVFTEEDVAFGTALARVLDERPGELSLRQAAEIAREQTKPDAPRTGREGRKGRSR